MLFHSLSFDRHVHHPMNFVRYTAWPFFLSWSLFLFFFFMLSYLHYIVWALPLFIVGFLFFVFFLDLWSNDIFIESSLFGNYSRKLCSGIILGFLVFLLSELVVFSGFFWAFFDISFNGSIMFFKNYSLFDNIGVEGYLNLFVPFYGTVLLEMSARFAILSYYYLKYGMLEYSQGFLLLVFTCGIFFLFIQYKEYDTVLFNINDDALASCFFMLTGFHAFHVFVGLLVFYEYYEYNFSSSFLSNSFFFNKEINTRYFPSTDKDVYLPQPYRVDHDASLETKFAAEFYGVYVVHLRYDSLDDSHKERNVHTLWHDYKLGLLEKLNVDLDDIKRKEFADGLYESEELSYHKYVVDRGYRQAINNQVNDSLDLHHYRLFSVASFLMNYVYRFRNSNSVTEIFDTGMPTIERSVLFPVALMYWTFVDVVWFFLFCVVYVDCFSFI